MANFTYEVLENLGTISDKGAWCCELNVISWNHRAPSYDIRKWTDTHERMGKGISLSLSELIALRDLLNDLDLEDRED